MAILLADDPEAEDFEYVAFFCSHTQYTFARYSNGWLRSFCERKGISNQARTEKKKLTVQEREPLLQEFHCQVADLQQEFIPVVDSNHV